MPDESTVSSMTLPTAQEIAAIFPRLNMKPIRGTVILYDVEGVWAGCAVGALGANTGVLPQQPVRAFLVDNGYPLMWLIGVSDGFEGLVNIHDSDSLDCLVCDGEYATGHKTGAEVAQLVGLSPGYEEK